MNATKVATFVASLVLIVTRLPVDCQFKPFHACQVRPCFEQSLLTCSLRDQPWAALLYNGRPVCVCCSDERDARIAAGSNVMSGKGLFWGNRLKVCETVYIDELTCQARQLRDCNYQTIVYKGTFVGCFYCRALCGTSVDCRDLGRTCGLSKRYQPVRSCTFTPYVVTDYEYDPEVPPASGLVNGNPSSYLASSNNNLLYIKEDANDTVTFYSDFDKILMRFTNETTSETNKPSDFTEYIKTNSTNRTTLDP